MIAKLKDKLEQLNLQVPLEEDAHWLYFGHGEGWGNKCERCYDHLKTYRRPGLECVNCWKFEIWAGNLTSLEEAMIYLVKEAKLDHTLHGKLLKKPGPVYESANKRLSSGTSHSIPEEAKPDTYLKGELKEDRFILIYTQSIAERDRRMAKIIGDLKDRGIYKKEMAPYRRGCIQPHESILGPWEKWFDLDKDMTD